MSIAINEEPLMLLFMVAGVGVVALVVIALARNGRRDRAAGDLGSVSQAWIAEHRSSWSDQ